jgi:hypothetical protein
MASLAELARIPAFATLMPHTTETAKRFRDDRPLAISFCLRYGTPVLLNCLGDASGALAFACRQQQIRRAPYGAR